MAAAIPPNKGIKMKFKTTLTAIPASDATIYLISCFAGIKKRLPTKYVPKDAIANEKERTLRYQTESSNFPPTNKRTICGEIRITPIIAGIIK